MAVKWKWTNTNGGGSVPADLEHRVEQLENELTPIQTNITTLQNNQSALGNQVQTLEGQAVKIAGDQNIGGNKTFTAPIKSSANSFMSSTSTTNVLAEITAQGEKSAVIKFIQPTSGFRNYTHFKLQVQNGSSGTVVDVISLDTRDTNAGAYMTFEANKLNFGNPTTITGIATPTADTQAVPKSYVDAIKTKIKEIAAASTDFADFKNRIAGW